MYNYTGAFHIHSEFSDGTGSISHIIKCAQMAKLDWIIISDHNNLDGSSYEGFYDGLCVLVGSEISPPDGNHLVALDIKEKIECDIGPRSYIDEVHKQNGVCFVAHPDESIKRENKQKPLRWKDWSINSFDGIEIWNYLSDWTDLYSVKKNQLLQYINRHKMVKGPSKAVLNWWDELNKTSEIPFPCIGGVDAHQFLIKKFGFTIKLSEYYDYFTALNNIIFLDEKLSNDFETAKQQIISSLKKGNSYIINRRAVKSDNNPEIYIENKNEKIKIGSCYEYEKYAHLVIKLAKKCLIKIICNGVCIEEFSTKNLEYQGLKQGKFRVEIYKDNLPYIFTNYFFII